jgi:hypothetical protein
MVRLVAGALACLSGKRRPLGYFWKVLWSRLAKRFDIRWLHTTGVGTSQPDTAPEVSASPVVEGQNRRHDLRNVRSLDKPQAPPQPLVKRASRIGGQPRNGLLLSHVFCPMEIPLVEPIAVQHQPTEQRVELLQV